mgnify:CR=1 FL=1
MQKITILTHRGLEPSNSEFWPESSFEAFQSHIERGFSIEFDPNFCKDEIVVSHDSTLKRITEGKDERNFSEHSINELKFITYGKEKQGRIPSLSEIFDLIRESKASSHALHLKGKYQEKEKIDLLLNVLAMYADTLNKLILFDIKPETAKYIKSRFPQLNLVPSVAHYFDIQRYNGLIYNTLLTLEDAIKYKGEGLYNWVWLDEWDTIDAEGKEKLFYTAENFKILRDAGFKIALVTPELHGTSPGLYGGESHKHAADKNILFQRIKEILALNPDAICTDYPNEVRNF